MAKKPRREDRVADDMDRAIARILAGAHGDDAELRAFHRIFQATIELPCDAFVIGEPVSILAFEYDGHPRRGLTARCRREDGSEHSVAALDIVFPTQSIGVPFVALYRKWSGIDPFPKEVVSPTPRKRQLDAKPTGIDLSRPVELVVLSVKEKEARCRFLGKARAITLRAKEHDDLVPGQIAVVRPNKHWTRAGHPYLSGEIEATRIDATALGLVPLKLEKRGMWTPQAQDWRDEKGAIAEWAKPIVERGPRPKFELESIALGADPEDLESDPVCQAMEFLECGDGEAATKLLMEACEADLRCLDAHALLGDYVFRLDVHEAILHYEVGIRIGELSLGHDFDGVLSSGVAGNLPFLRCLHGYGMCLWRLDRFEEARRIFERTLWLNPMDDHGVRFCIEEIKAGEAWEDDSEEI